MGVLNLPPIPAELKPITPYLQRADEVKPTDPVIAYWCAYHAAQLGISLKLKDPAARTFLFELLGLLEHMKTEIGPSDAIDDESASSAYVENFALRVFAMADNEDRKGNATRGTAKKFLAAANFLEVLSVVTASTPTTINVPEKIRYAKWKAADIAKAFREGRKPLPGSAEEQRQQQEAVEQAEFMDTDPASPPPAIQRGTPPPGQIYDMPQDISEPVAGALSPGWSTVATPGASGVVESDFADRHHAGAPQSHLGQAWVSDELEGKDDAEVEAALNQAPEIPARPQMSSSYSGSTGVKNVHFSPSVTGGLTPSAVGPDSNPFTLPSVPIPPPEYVAPGVIPSAPPLDISEFPSELSDDVPPSFPMPTSPPEIPPARPTFPPTRPAPSYRTAPQPPPPAMEATVTQTIEGFTPQEISRTQKHCRFAISALDYEDIETAKKELRAALQMLGG